MFDLARHQELITPSEEMDLSPKNKKKLEAWKKQQAKDKRKNEVLRFVPSRKQFYEGGVRGIFWPGRTIHNTANGIPHVTPSDNYEITKDGYCPKDEPEAIRLLFLSQTPQNRICLHEDRELGNEAKTSELNFQRLKEENAKMQEEMEDLRRRVAEKGAK